MHNPDNSQQQKTIAFASTNGNKYEEARSMLAAHGIAAEFAQVSPVEVQSDSLGEIAAEKAKSAYSLVKRPVIVEDDGLFIRALNGFPGQYSSYVFKTIGNAGILRLLAMEQDRSASFRSVIAYFDGSTLQAFEGVVEGSIAFRPASGGWGYDPIFVPGETSITFAELGANKGEYSHRRRALDKFASWYCSS